ncbi:MAG: SDR family oxidoreductase [Chloroflexi bacterium]|nr:SDR family oxidoreductase [Chloroflexota bacterium]
MFEQEHALITGGSSGIGKAIACELARRGAHVTLVARTPSRLEEAAAEITACRHSAGQTVQTFVVDVRDAQAVHRVVTEVEGAGGAIDLLVNAAGIAHPGYFHELPLSVFRDTMEINYFGTVHTTQAVAPAMMQRRRGRILNFSSMGGLAAVFGYTAYSASKFAVRGFSEALRSELKPYGITVSVVYPPDTDTPQLASENRIKPPETKRIAAAAKVMQPEAVARIALEGVARGKVLIIPGLESRLLYIALQVAGAAAHSVTDMLVRQAQAEKK